MPLYSKSTSHDGRAVHTALSGRRLRLRGRCTPLTPHRAAVPKHTPLPPSALLLDTHMLDTHVHLSRAAGIGLAVQLSARLGGL